MLFRPQMFPNVSLIFELMRKKLQRTKTETRTMPFLKDSHATKCWWMQNQTRMRWSPLVRTLVSHAASYFCTFFFFLHLLLSTGIQTAVRMLEHTLKTLNVYRDSKPKLDSIQTPYREREKKVWCFSFIHMHSHSTLLSNYDKCSKNCKEQNVIVSVSWLKITFLYTD